MQTLDQIKALLDVHTDEVDKLDRDRTALATSLDAAHAKIAELETRITAQRQALDAASSKIAALTPAPAPATVPASVPAPSVPAPAADAGKPRAVGKSGAVGKYALGLLLAVGLSFGAAGCIPLQSLGDGAAAAAANQGKPLPPPPAGDSPTLYQIGAGILLAGLSVAGLLTHSSVVGNLAGMLAQSVPAASHGQALAKLPDPAAGTGTPTI
jgi:hypothetical protein